MNDRALWFVGAALFAVAAIGAGVGGQILLAAGMAVLSLALGMLGSREGGGRGEHEPRGARTEP